LYHRYQLGLSKRHFKRPYAARWGGFLAHLGLAISIVGVVLTHSYSEERDLRMQIGEAAQLGPYRFKLLAVNDVQGTNYHAARADVLVSDHAKKNHGINKAALIAIIKIIVNAFNKLRGSRSFQ